MGIFVHFTERVYLPLMKQGLTVDEVRKQAFLSVKDVSELLNMGTTYVYAHIKSPDCAFNVVTMYS